MLFDSFLLKKLKISSQLPFLCICYAKPEHGNLLKIINIFGSISSSNSLNAFIFLSKSIRLYFPIVIISITHKQANLLFHEKLFYESASDIFVIFCLGTVLNNVVNFGAASFFVIELQGFLYLWKLYIFLFNGVDEMTTLDEFLKWFELELKS